MQQELSFNGLPMSGIMLRNNFQYLAAPNAKIERLVDAGMLIRLRRNLYIDTQAPIYNNFLAANYILSPSYVSGLSALWYYDIIPETVFENISMTTRKRATYNNALGRFSYYTCTPDYFYIGITPTRILGNTVMIAGKEKALCDHIILTPNINFRYVKETRTWLEEEMRMDMDELSTMDLSIIKECARVGRKQRMLSNIIKIFS